MEFVLYKVTSPSRKVYVGVTCQSFALRQAQHIRAASNGSTFKLHQAIRKYRDTMIWEIVAKTSSREEAFRLEQELIKSYDSFINGYNSTLGGEGVFGAPWNLGRKHSDETKMAISHALTGTTRDSVICALNAGGKPFKVTDSKGQVVGVWTSQKACARDLNLHNTLINYCLNGKRATHGGYTFKFLE